MPPATKTRTALPAAEPAPLLASVPPVPIEELEAYQELMQVARRKTGVIPEDLIVRHVLRVTNGGDWPVQLAALNALLRRLGSAEKDKLQIATRPPRGRVLGRYETQRRGRGGGVRPYLTLLEGVAPPLGRCGCPDYIKSSLGLCKHLLTLLCAIHARPRRLAAAQAEQERRHLTTRPARLVFDPVRPLTGPGDLLGQVHWESGEEPKGDMRYRRARRWFATGQEGMLPLRDTYPGDAKKRLALVDDLFSLLDEKQPECDPALVALLAEEKEALGHVLRDAELVAHLRPSLRSLKCPLYPYQIEGVERFLSSGRLLLADDMGLGKTAQAIAACHVLWHAGRVRRGLISVPASLKPQWLREWQHFTEVPITLVDGPRNEREAIYRKTKTGFLLVNYEQVLRDLPLMQEFQPDLVVLDEAQRIKNWATKTATYVKTLDSTYRLVLTGTPMENRLDELASLLDWVAPLAIEPKWRLQPWHTRLADNSAGGARNLDTLRQRLSGCMVRRIRQEVLQQLPSRTDTRVPVEMTGEQCAAHDELNPPIAQLLAILRKRPLTPAQHIRLMMLLTAQRIISNGMAQMNFPEVWPTIRDADVPHPSLRDGLFAPKLEMLRELVRHLVIDQGRKVVIFSQWRRMLRLADWVLRDVLREAEARAVFFTGGENTRRRTQNIVEFHDDPQTRVMFLTDAGGVGLNLQRAASSCINLELPWNPAVLEQRISRIYRIGQKQPIDVYNLVTERGIESRIAEILGGKKALFTGLFDGTSNEILFERSGSFLSRIEQLVPEAAQQAEELFAEQADGEGSEDQDGAAPVDTEVSDILQRADEQQDDADPHLLEGSSAITLPPHEAAPEAVPEHVAPPVLPATMAHDGPHAPQPAPAAAGPESPPVVEPEGPVVEPESPPGAAASPPVSAEAVRHLFSELTIQRTEGGGIAISASPAAAGTLAALFQGMASLLQEAAR